MAKVRTFLAIHSAKAKSKLLGLREKANLVDTASESTVLLIIASNATDDARVAARFRQSWASFEEICYRSIEKCFGKIPVISSRGTGIACGWFPAGSFDAVNAALDINEKVEAWQRQTSESPRLSFHSAIAENEYSAHRLVRMAGENQIVVQVELWDEWQTELKKCKTTASIHPPEFQRRHKETTKTITGVMDQIPWGELPSPVAARQKKAGRRPAAAALAAQN